MWCSYGAVACLFLLFVQRGGHDDQRLLQIGFLLALAAALVVTGRASALTALLTPVARWLLGGFFALGTLSAALALSPRHAFYEVSSLLLLAVLALAVGAEIARDRAEGMPRLLRAIGFVCLLYGFKIVVVYLSAFSLGQRVDAGDLAPGFNNYRFLNHAQTVTLPLLVLLYLLTPAASRMRWTWFALAALWWAVLYGTAARGSWLGLFAGCVLALVLRHRHALAFVRTMAFAALAGAAIYLVFFMLLPSLAGLGAFGEFSHVVERTVADPASGRLNLWRRALELVAAHPWLGVGPLHFAHYGAELHGGAHPHNWLLQIAAEWGLPALLCLVAAIGLALRGLVRSAGQIGAGDLRNQDTLAALCAAGGALLVDGLVSGSIVMPQSQLVIALYIGCALGWSAAFRSAVAPAGSGQVARAAAVIVVLGAMLGLWAAVAPDIGARWRHDPLTGHDAQVNQGGCWPRMWLAGYF